MFCFARQSKCHLIEMEEKIVILARGKHGIVKRTKEGRNKQIYCLQFASIERHLPA